MLFKVFDSNIVKHLDMNGSPNKNLNYYSLRWAKLTFLSLDKISIGKLWLIVVVKYFILILY